MIRATCRGKLIELIALVATLGAPGLAIADSWPAPGARIFGSQCGRRGVTVVARPKPNEDCQREQAEKPPGEREFFNVTATMFTMDDDGQQRTIWTKALPYIPNRMVVNDNGQVVGVDEYFRLGYKHALVVFDAEGEIVADYRLEDLLTGREIKDNALQTASSRMWASVAQFEFEHRNFLLVRLKWGKVITIDLKTGKLWPGFDPGTYKTDADFDKASEKYRKAHRL